MGKQQGIVDLFNLWKVEDTRHRGKRVHFMPFHAYNLYGLSRGTSALSPGPLFL